MSTNFTSPLEEPGISNRTIDPCIMVIFGASGDLTARKLLPALYNLAKEGQLPPQFACVGFARRAKTHEEFRAEMKASIEQFSRSKPIDPALWDKFKEHLFYHQSEFHDPAGYQKLNAFLGELDGKLGTRGNRVFYLATQPSFFTEICKQLHGASLIYDGEKTQDKWSRVIIEKPFGRDLQSAKNLQQELLLFLKEDQIYRIDHYLGKETVQNLLVFRFANVLFESVWNNRYIDHVQITVAEDIGIGSRGAFWEEAGMLRDIVQNHMMQLLSLVAMEPPVNLSARSIHDEKVKVLQGIRPFSEKDLQESIVRGQYGKGFVGGKEVLSYREEKNVSPTSSMETYMALRLWIDNWRWAGVPFYLRGGKRMPKKVTEIAIVFKDPPHVLFQNMGTNHVPNTLTIRIQPNEGIALKINCKVPGPSSPIQPVKMDFRYGSYFGMSPPEAYERLIQDCILGDKTLFARQDEVFNSWALLTPVLESWEKQKSTGCQSYAAGSWGPENANTMLARDGRKWRLI